MEPLDENTSLSLPGGRAGTRIIITCRRMGMALLVEIWKKSKILFPSILASRDFNTTVIHEVSQYHVTDPVPKRKHKFTSLPAIRHPSAMLLCYRPKFKGLPAV